MPVTGSVRRCGASPLPAYVLAEQEKEALFEASPNPTVLRNAYRSIDAKARRSLSSQTTESALAQLERYIRNVCCRSLDRALAELFVIDHRLAQQGALFHGALSGANSDGARRAGLAVAALRLLIKSPKGRT